MIRRKLGAAGPEVSAIGLGCMGMSEFYGATDELEAVKTLHRAVELGVTLVDTADMYGQGANELLVGEALTTLRDAVFLATKFGMLRDTDGRHSGIDGSPSYVRKACDASLRRLGTEVIDLYQLHRVDPRVPIEETVGAMAELVEAGKVRFIGLSEAQPEDIRRAASEARITSLQNEYSLFERRVEGEVLDVCEELGIGLLAYAPLGRGMLTGRYRTTEGLAANDWRHNGPRWLEGNLEQNSQLVDRVQEIATAKGVTAGQIALAWLLARRPWVVPIPGTRRASHLEENIGSTDIELTAVDLEVLDSLSGQVAGDRYPPEREPTWISPSRR